MTTVAVFGGSATLPGDPDYRAAQDLGRRLGELGVDVANGGYGGTMEAVSAGARASGANVIGVLASEVFPGRSGPNGHLTTTVDASTIAQRIQKLVDMADIAIVLPGSLGTLAEFLVAWNTAFVAQFSGTPPLPVIVVGAAWKDLAGAVGRGFGAETGHLLFADTAEDAASLVRELIPGTEPDR